MEIVVNLEPWPDDSPVIHNSTKIIIKNEHRVEAMPSEIITGLVYVKEIDIPIGMTYYVIAERQFSLRDSEYDISNINYESEEFPIINNEKDISNMLLAKDIVIETPYIFVNRNDIISSTGGDTFTIKSGKFKGVGEGHTHTHWIIKNGDTIIDRYINDAINKTSLVLPKSLVKNLSSFEIYCVHCSNNIESNISKLKITLNSLNFELSSNIASLVSTGTKLLIKRVDNTKPIGLSKIIFKHNNENIKILETNPLLEDDYNYIISSSILEIKRDMVIELYGNDHTGELGKKVYKIDLVDNLYNNDSSNPDIKYEMKITELSFLGKLPIMVTDSFRNFIFVPNNGLLDIYNVSEDGSLTYNKAIQSLTLGLVNNENIYVKYTDSNYLIVDAMLNTHPRFIIFKHDIYNDRFILDNIIDREDEIISLGYNNAIEFIDEEHFIYSVYGSNSMKKVNYKTGAIINTKDIPETNIDGAMILKMFDNNLLVLSNKTYKTFIYNIDEDAFKPAMSIPYNQFISKDLKKIDLANGDKVLITIDDITSDGSIAWFNTKESTLTLLKDKLKTISNNYSIYRKNNENFIAVFKPKDYLTYDADTVLVQKII